MHQLTDHWAIWSRHQSVCQHSWKVSVLESKTAPAGDCSSKQLNLWPFLLYLFRCSESFLLSNPAPTQFNYSSALAVSASVDNSLHFSFVPYLCVLLFMYCFCTLVLELVPLALFDSAIGQWKSQQPLAPSSNVNVCSRQLLHYCYHHRHQIAIVISEDINNSSSLWYPLRLSGSTLVAAFVYPLHCCRKQADKRSAMAALHFSLKQHSLTCWCTGAALPNTECTIYSSFHLW